MLRANLAAGARPSTSRKPIAQDLDEAFSSPPRRPMLERRQNHPGNARDPRQVDLRPMAYGAASRCIHCGLFGPLDHL